VYSRQCGQGFTHLVWLRHWPFTLVTMTHVSLGVTHHKQLPGQQVWRWSCNSTHRFRFCQESGYAEFTAGTARHS